MSSRRDLVKPVQRPRHEGEILAMYGRASSLFEAMRILVRREHPEEAFVLGRALFSESLRVEELARADTKGRGALVWAGSPARGKESKESRGKSKSAEQGSLIRT